MQTIEFETEEKNGVINIPKKILKKVKRHHLKIVMSYQDEEETKESRKETIADFAGIWEGRDISLEDIRKKAWK